MVAPVFDEMKTYFELYVGDDPVTIGGFAREEDGMLGYQWYRSINGGKYEKLPYQRPRGLAPAEELAPSPSLAPDLVLPGNNSPFLTVSAETAGEYTYYCRASVYVGGVAVMSARSPVITVIVRLTAAQKYLMYLDTVKGSFTKLTRLRFLNPDGSTAFAVDSRGGGHSKALIADGSLTVNLTNGQRRSASVTLNNLDRAFEYNVNRIWFGRRIALDEGIVLPNGEEYYFPQGVFYARDPEEAFSPGKRTVTYSLTDKWAYLDGTLFGNLEGIYEVPLGSNIFEALRGLLLSDRGDGVPIDDTPPVFTDFYNGLFTVLPDGTRAPMLETPYTIRQDGTGGTYADVILELADIIAAHIGYDALGRLRIEPSQDDLLDEDKPVVWDFLPENVQFLGATYSISNSEVYNDIIVEGEAVSEEAQPAGRAQNLDPASDTCVARIGRKTMRVSGRGYYSAAQCADVAAWYLKRYTVLKKSVSISAGQLFHLRENRLVTLARRDKKGSPRERHLVTGFTLPLGQTGTMTVNATSVLDFPQATIVTVG